MPNDLKLYSNGQIFYLNGQIFSCPQAAYAALARFAPSEGATSSSDLERRRYQAKIQAMAKKELEEEKKVL